MSQKKLPTFEITPIIWGQKFSVGVFGMNVEMRSYFFMQHIFKWLVRTGVTEVNDTKSRAKFLHVAFQLLVFIRIF